MNKIVKTIGATALLTSLAVTASVADSSDFAGPYVGIQGSAVGVELDGDHTTAATTGTGSTASQLTTGTVGKTAMIAGLEIGYAIPLSSEFLLDVGINYVNGSAKINNTTNDTSSAAAVTFEVSDLITGYIAPTFAVSDTSSIYLKIGYTEADTKVTGDVTKPSDLSGTTVALGTRSLLGNGLFIRTEAGMTEYDTISVKGKAEGGTATLIKTTTTVSAEPTVAFGAISIGMKF